MNFSVLAGVYSIVVRYDFGRWSGGCVGMKRLCGLIAVAMAVTFAAGESEHTATPKGRGLDAELVSRAEDAVGSAVSWLVAQQSPSGSWSNPSFPALTGLPVWALSRSGQAGIATNIEQGVAYILACVSTNGIHDGAIFKEVQGRKGGGLANYNTAICMTALHAVGDRRLTPVVLKAREFLARSQYLQKGQHYGGMGYDPPTGRAYTDLSNSYLGYEAMRLTQDVEDLRPGGKTVDMNWKAAQEFMQGCHNDSSFNAASWASSDAGEKGGFAYRPDEYRKNSGAYTNEAGEVKFRSMPGMTYAGLLSYIYAGVDRADPRVKATVAWIQANWQLDRGNRNPDMAGKAEEREGLFYMYNILAKGLHAYGQDTLTLADGRTINWREALIRKLLALQNPDGFWVNDNNRYWEGDPVLVTAYSLLALETVLDR